MSVTGITASNPYSNVNDLLSNVRNFKIIESTLSVTAESMVLTLSSEQAVSTILLRCVSLPSTNLLEEFLRTHSLGGRDMKAITKQALEVIEYIKSRGCEVRFSSEDSFRRFLPDRPNYLPVEMPWTLEMDHDGREMEEKPESHTQTLIARHDTASGLWLLSLCIAKWNKQACSSPSKAWLFLAVSDLVDLLSIYRAASNAGVGRVGVADTVGCASPRQVYDLVRTLRGCVSTDIEVHFHDDTGCAVANSFTALEAGATHIDTSVLGIGERNGICPLGALMARMMPTSRDYILSKYKVHQLKAIEDFVAETVEINVPFNNPITGFCAFTHKAGIHAKAILNDPSTYEILKPEDFDSKLQRSVHFTSRLTGWNAIKSRVDQLGLKMTDDQIKEVTAKIKQMADLKVMTLDESDALIRSFHLELTQAQNN
ncbi:hypothetical protein ACHAPX_010532 [Trichoderma viride]